MILFTADNYEFHDNGKAKDLLLVRDYPRVNYVVEPCDNPGDDCKVFWVWDDQSMSLASDDIQQAYLNYIATQVVT